MDETFNTVILKYNIYFLLYLVNTVYTAVYYLLLGIYIYKHTGTSRRHILGGGMSLKYLKWNVWKKNQQLSVFANYILFPRVRPGDTIGGIKYI